MSEREYGLPFVPKGAWLEERYVRCGKSCRCRQGEPHGTYWRLCWRQRGSRRQRYVAAEDAPTYQLAVQARRRQTSMGRMQRRSAELAVAHARAVLRATAAEVRQIRPSTASQQWVAEMDEWVMSEMY